MPQATTHMVEPVGGVDDYVRAELNELVDWAKYREAACKGLGVISEGELNRQPLREVHWKPKIVGEQIIMVAHHSHSGGKIAGARIHGYGEGEEDGQEAEISGTNFGGKWRDMALQGQEGPERPYAKHLRASDRKEVIFFVINRVLRSQILDEKCRKKLRKAALRLMFGETAPTHVFGE